MTFFAIRPPVVVDASVVVGVLTGERLPSTAWTRWVDDGQPLIAPPLLLVEAGDVLIRRYRIPAAQAAEQLRTVVDAGVELADRGLAGVSGALGIAERHGLTVYDATYLWLASDIEGELATLDQALSTAAQAEGVALATELRSA